MINASTKLEHENDRVNKILNFPSVKKRNKSTKINVYESNYYYNQRSRNRLKNAELRLYYRLLLHNVM